MTAPITFHLPQSIPYDPLSSTAKALLAVGMVTAVALMVIGGLALLSAHGTQLGGCLASIGVQKGLVLLFTGFGFAMIESAIIYVKSPIKIPAPNLDEGFMQPTSKNFCGVTRFVNGKYDYNPLLNTLENMYLLPLGGFRHFLPKSEDIPKLVDPHPPVGLQGEVDIQWMGHDSFLIQTANTTILTGPNWSQTIPFVGSIPLYYRSLDPGVPFPQLPGIDYVLLSHTHRDHFDLPTLNLLRERDHPTFLCPTNAKKLLQGFDDQSIVEMSWWDTLTFLGENEIVFTYVPANHASQTNARDPNICLWGGYVISIPLSNGERYRIYFMGDTACNINRYIEGFRPEYWANDTKLFYDISQLGPFDLIICGIDPIDGQEFDHANIAQLSDLFTRMNPGMIIPGHWGTWPFDRWGSELLEPVEHFKTQIHPSLYDRVKQMKVGEKISLVGNSPNA